MAQYFQVLSQADNKSVEELRQYYPNIVENQGVQYVVSPQEVGIAGQQIIVSAGVANPPVMEQQQIQIDSNKQPVVLEQQIAQPLVLNHQIQQNQVVTVSMPNSSNVMVQRNVAQQRPIGIRPPTQQVPQMQVRQQMPSVSPQIMQQRAPRLPQPRPMMIQQRPQQPVKSPQRLQRPFQQFAQRAPQQSVPQRRPIQQQPHGIASQSGSKMSPDKYAASIVLDSAEDDKQSSSGNRQLITLEDGRTLTEMEYKRLLQQKQAAQTIQERLQSSPLMPPGVMNKQKAVRQSANANRNQRGGAGRGNRGRGGRSGPNAVPSSQYSELDVNLGPQQQPANQPQLAQQRQQQQPPPNMQQAAPPGGQGGQFQQQYSQSLERCGQYVIQPHVAQQQQVNNAPCTLPSYIPSSQIQQIIDSTPKSEEDSIRMLVLLPDGEQRLITFTLPKEACTIHEILEQVDVQVTPETNIVVTEYGNGGLHYVVTVGNPAVYSQDETNSANSTNNAVSDATSAEAKQITVSSTEQSQESNEQEAEQPKELPKYVPGMLAVCGYCGYLSEDFNRCIRCRKKLPEDVKSRPNDRADRKGIGEHQSAKQLQSTKSQPVNSNAKKKPKPKVVDAEPVILTLSSDDEDEVPKACLADRLHDSAIAAAITKKEPSLTEIKQNSSNEDLEKEKGYKEFTPLHPDVSIAIICRTIRIGSYRFVPPDSVRIKSGGIVIQVPSLKNPGEIITVAVERKQIVKVLVNFQKILPVIFYYVTPSIGKMFREQLGMIEGADPYFDPLSKEEAHKRITILPENFQDDMKKVFKQIYGLPVSIMDELTSKEANDILLKTCPKEITKVITGTSLTEIKQLLIYPPGKGGLPINTEDYLCLAQDQFLNDVILDFYLKYVVLQLPEQQRNKVHVFSTFFYKRLTTKPYKPTRRSHPNELDTSLSPAQKRHSRVKSWTKNVNLFEKDFVIVPINEHCHWFLAIICFPGMDDTYTMDGKPIKLEPKQKKKKPSTTTTIGNVTITTVKVEKEEQQLSCEEGELSDKDEAEGDDSELESEEDREATPEPQQQPQQSTQVRPPIKQPCILIFDSLAGACRSRVVATLRDYLTCEYKAKMGVERIFNKDVIKGACPKVPQQTNFTDCGLYVLQYVEQFFKDPIKDFHIPINHLKTWFDELTVTKKREDISLLIKSLMKDYNIDTNMLPIIPFPTKDGNLVEHPVAEEEEEELEEEQSTTELKSDSAINESMEVEAEASGMKVQEPLSSDNEKQSCLKEASQESDVPKQACEFLEEKVPNVLLKPDLSEIQRQSSRETMMYLKAKRIIRHKNNEETEAKKLKTE